jgi:hypothetical protein
MSDVSNILNDTLLNEKRLLEIVASSSSENEGENRQKKTAADVKFPYYEKLMFYRGKNEDDGIPQFFQAWTLIVVWNDDTMDCWVNALDVARGLGYTTGHIMNNISSFLSGDDRLVRWDTISKFIYNNTCCSPHYSVQIIHNGGGIQQAN